MQPYDTTGRRLPLPPEPWKDANQRQLLQFLKTQQGTKLLPSPHRLPIHWPYTATTKNRVTYCSYAVL